MSGILEYLGLKGSVLAAGLAGGVLRALSRRRYKAREVFASPICGALAAGYLTDSVLHYLRTVGIAVHPADQVASNAAAFCIGACAMWIADILLEAVVRYFKPEAG
jgi:hypothetical protein